MKYEQHPLSAAFPSMPSPEIEALAMDIEAHGQREPGVIYEDMVLDGWHRYLACEKAGVKFKAEEYEGDDPVAFVISRNLHRRHLTASQRAACVVDAAKWRPSGVQDGKAAAAATMTETQMAKAAEVSERTIRHAKAAAAAGLSDPVKAGEVSAERAAEVAKLPKAKRKKALTEPKEKKPRVIAADPKFERLYEEVKGELTETREKLADLADTARELQDKLTMFEAVEPDEQQKEIAKLQKRCVRLEAEIERLTRDRADCNNKNNQLIREVKRLRKKAGE